MKPQAVSVFPEVRRSTSSRKRWALRLLLALLVVLALGWFLATRWVEAQVRARLTSMAERHGMSVECGEVGFGWFRVHVAQVTLWMEPTAERGAEELTVVLDRIEVGTRWNGAPEEILARGGRVVAKGELDALRARLGMTSSASPTQSEASPVRMALTDWSIEWQDDARSVHVEGMSAEQNGAQRTVAARELTLRLTSGAQLSAHTASIELQGKLLQNVQIQAMELTAHQEPVKPAERTPPHTERADDATLRLPWPELGRWRQLALALATRVSEHLTGEAQVLVEGLRVDLGGDVRFGPAPFRVTRRRGDGDVLVVELSPASSAAATPLSFHVDVPIGEGDPSASFAGGPVPLRALGFAEGQMFLHHTDVATVRGNGNLRLAKDAIGTALHLDLAVDFEHVGVEHARLAKEPIDDVSFGGDLRGVIHEGSVSIEQAALRLGDLRVAARGGLTQLEDALIGQAHVTIQDVRCDVLHQAIPTALAPHLRDFHFDGHFGFDAELRFDTRALDDLTLEIRQGGVCRASSVPEWATRQHFQREFRYTVYDPEGKPREETTGPGSGHYTALDDISPFMQVAVLTSEDGGFYHHHGWSKNAIRRALIANLKAGRFRQGASTISMQLAKNLFLSRDKTLSRKLEELVLTDYLEQTFQKSEMMELYLNIIEFGPDVYGITNAARYYFGREPEELQLAECMFLTSLLPSPVKRARQREKKELLGGARSGIDFLIRAAEKHGKITALERDIGLTQPIVFHLGGERPPPRAPVRGSRFEGEDEPE